LTFLLANSVSITRPLPPNILAQVGGAKTSIGIVGYLLFIGLSHSCFQRGTTTPDMLVMGILFLTCGLLLKIRIGARGWISFAMLGVVLGCGYLVKAPMFPLAFMFLGIAFLLVGDFKKAAPAFSSLWCFSL